MIWMGLSIWITVLLFIFSLLLIIISAFSLSRIKQIKTLKISVTFIFFSWIANISSIALLDRFTSQPMNNNILYSPTVLSILGIISLLLLASSIYLLIYSFIGSSEIKKSDQ